MKIEQAKIDELKKAHSEGVFEGGISFNDNDDALQEVEFVYRKPTLADMEAYSKAAQRNPIIANLNLVQSLIVFPDPAPIIAQIREYPAAYSKFVDEVVSPFFGSNAAVRSRKL
jgi:hypothetical protein